LEDCLKLSAESGDNLVSNTFGIDFKEEKTCSCCGYVLPEVPENPTSCSNARANIYVRIYIYI